MTSRRPKWVNLSRIAALTGLALAISMGTAEAQGRPAAVLAERVELRAVTDTTPVLAQFVPTVEARVAARTAGVVAEVLFRVGDRVDAGAELVRLDRDLIEIRRRTAQAALAASQAGVNVAEAKLQLARQAFERTSQLQGSTAFSRGQFDDLQTGLSQAQSELAQATAMVAQAEAELARADYDLSHATIRAPFSGVVVQRAAQPGSYIALGEAAATLLDTGALEIEANLPARLVGAITPGTALEARLNGRTATATVRSLLPVEAATTRTRPVRLSVDPADVADLPLAAGNSVTLMVPVSAPRRLVTVPKDALVQAGGGGWQVFTVEDGTAVPRLVSLGAADGDRMEVLTGLIPGDIVVVRGNERLRPGQPVEARVRGNDPEAPTGTPDKSLPETSRSRAPAEPS